MTDLHFAPYLVPRVSTQAASFSKLRSVDGSGIVIAILDTGLDPACPALQTLPDGETPKVLGYYDATLSGRIPLRQIHTLTPSSPTFTSPYSNLTYTYTPTSEEEGGSIEILLSYKALHPLFCPRLKKRLLPLHKRDFFRKSRSQRQKGAPPSNSSRLLEEGFTYDDPGSFVDVIVWRWKKDDQDDQEEDWRVSLVNFEYWEMKMEDGVEEEEEDGDGEDGVVVVGREDGKEEEEEEEEEGEVVIAAAAVAPTDGDGAGQGEEQQTQTLDDGSIEPLAEPAAAAAAAAAAAEDQEEEEVEEPVQPAPARAPIRLIDLSALPFIWSYETALQRTDVPREVHTYARIPDRHSEMYYTVNLPPNSDSETEPVPAFIDLVLPNNAHGTHVGCITAGWAPPTSDDLPDSNAVFCGVAPGASLVSIKIGDSRFSYAGMETGESVIRALMLVKELGVHMVNFSFGEPSDFESVGPIREILRSLVRENGLVFVASAGNSGPAFSTASAPGSLYSDVFGVGAYRNELIERAQYGFDGNCEDDEGEEEEDEGETVTELKPASETLHLFSSSGPTCGGWYGTSFCAPGSAVTAVPKYEVIRATLKNGTSMASPNGTGCLALLLQSIFRKNGEMEAEAVETGEDAHCRKRISAEYLRGVLWETSKLLPEVHPLRQGAGLIQVSSAMEYVDRYPDSALSPVAYDVDIAGKRGIYLRTAIADETTKSIVNVTPVFRECTPASVSGNFEKRTKLVWRVYDPETRSMKVLLNGKRPSWARCPRYLYLSNESNNFNVFLNPEMCPVGLTFAEVLAYDVDHYHHPLDEEGEEEMATTTEMTMMPEFRVPVTVIRPVVLDRRAGTAEFEYAFDPAVPGKKKISHFVQVPEGARAVSITVEGDPETLPTPNILVKLQAVQLISSVMFTHTSLKHYVRLAKDTPSVSHGMDVHEGQTLEVCLHLHWQYNRAIKLVAKLMFDPVSLLEGVSLHMSSPVRPVTLYGNLNRSSRRVKLEGSLSRYVRNVLPFTSSVAPVPDLIHPFDGRMASGISLEYQFDVSKKCTKSRVQLALVNDILYCSEFFSQMVFLHNLDSRELVGVLDYKAGTRDITLEKGSYLAQARLVTFEKDVLAAVKHTPLIVNTPMAEVKLDFYLNPNSALRRASSRTVSVNVRKSDTRVVYVTMDHTKLAKVSTEGGNCFTGTLILNFEELRPQYSLVYHIPPRQKKRKPVIPTSYPPPSVRRAVPPPPAPSKAAPYDDIKPRLSYFRDNHSDAGVREQLDDFLAEHPKNLHAWTIKLSSLIVLRRFLRGGDDADLDRAIILTCDQILGLVDREGILKAHVFGANLSSELSLSSAELKLSKLAFKSALCKRVSALCRLAHLEGITNYRETLVQANELLNAWCPKILDLPAEFELLQAMVALRLGTPQDALRIMKKVVFQSKKNVEFVVDILMRLRWKEWASYYRRWGFLKFPDEFARIW